MPSSLTRLRRRSPSPRLLLTLAIGAGLAALVLRQAPAAAQGGVLGRTSPIIGLLEHVATAIEALGVLVIVLGGLMAIFTFLRERERRDGWIGGYERLRANLGRAILLGLEFLVAADIIGTVAIAPSFESLGVLALIVLIRTFLSFSLEVEIKGHWPWRDSQMRSRREPEAKAD